ncbi:MAG: ROK family protein [Candidatus Pacebacteria bacterium]|nr:ROK family protein [Candidatus Paceibacterota bacterium]MBP9866568.1 ROK family protein [Candidatus Paceibacterota bacterium]
MYILIDIGGTNTRIARTDNKESFGEPVIFPTPEHFDEWFSIAIGHIDTLKQGETIEEIVAGMACIFSPDHSTIHSSPHLPMWQGINLKEKLGGWFNCTTTLQNDTAQVGLGEAVFGSGKGYDIVVYVTISTGVGGVRIVDGKIDKNKFGFEIGHQIVNADGKELEYYLAGSSHEKRFGIPSREIKDTDFWKEVNYYGGILAANTTMYWSPAVIVFGGPVVNDMNLEDVTNHTKIFTPMYETLPVIVKSSLGSLGGLYGGMAYLRGKN